ncbi:hypothetical protein B0H15DRAFT_1021439 [Mycena belliarum]|uniref:Uncharacterized protein n=1 Tax=Mycena belliarum TaxID=1033014 RepID=A0AAD6UA79_9AGAR|nr:hypothetical protein B0H15DRAFT_1021439 [Mycena belliae]
MLRLTATTTRHAARRLHTDVGRAGKVYAMPHINVGPYISPHAIRHRFFPNLLLPNPHPRTPNPHRPSVTVKETRVDGGATKVEVDVNLAVLGRQLFRRIAFALGALLVVRWAYRRFADFRQRADTMRRLALAFPDLETQDAPTLAAHLRAFMQLALPDPMAHDAMAAIARNPDPAKMRDAVLQVHAILARGELGAVSICVAVAQTLVRLVNTLGRKPVAADPAAGTDSLPLDSDFVSDAPPSTD